MTDYKNDERHTLIVYGQVFVDKKSGKAINYSLVPADRLRREDMQLIGEIFDTTADMDLWKWRKPSELAYVMGLADFGAAGSMRASKSMCLLNGTQRRKSNGQNLVLTPPLRVKTALNETIRERAEIMGFDNFKLGNEGIPINEQINKFFDFSQRDKNYWPWLTATQIVEVVGGSLEYSEVQWLRLVSKTMRYMTGNHTKRANGRDFIQCPPLKKEEGTNHA